MSARNGEEKYEEEKTGYWAKEDTRVEEETEAGKWGDEGERGNGQMGNGAQTGDEGEGKRK